MLAKLLWLFVSAQAQSAALIDCDYKIMGAPFSRIQLGFSEANAPEDFVTVIVQGNSHRESFTPEAAAESELLHGWISKESSENAIEMIVYKEAKPLGRSKIVNHKMPFGKEIWGSCNL